MIPKRCDICGKPFEAKRMNARYCSGACRKQSQRAGTQGPPKAGPARPTVVPLGSPSEGIAAKVQAELEKVGRAETSAGLQAIDLARQMEAVKAVSTLSAYATAHRELRAMIDAATKGVTVRKSAVQSKRDELAERRAARNASHR